VTATERVIIEIADPHCRAAELLTADLRMELATEYPKTATDRVLGGPQGCPAGSFIIARFGDEPIGCGALRALTAEVAEIEGLFVKRAARRLGVGKLLLTQLERLAAVWPFRRLRVEACVLHPAAITLCEHAGYRRIPNYGRHADNPFSVCYEKELSAA